jgi:cation transport ATPase
MSSSPISEKSPADPADLSETPKSAELKKPDPGPKHEEHGHSVEWAELVRIAFVALAAAAVWFRLWEPFPHISVIGIVATLIGGYPIFKEAFENIVERKMTMELSMTIALLSALVIGEFFTALVITGFVLAAEVLEGLTVGRGRRAIQSLLDFLPRTVAVRRNRQVVEVPSDQVQVDDTIIVKPGGHIPVDGIVLSGRSYVEQAAITGEAMPEPLISQARWKSAPRNSAVTRRSEESLKPSNTPRSRGLQFRKPQIGWPATLCILHWARRF